MFGPSPDRAGATRGAGAARVAAALAVAGALAVAASSAGAAGADAAGAPSAARGGGKTGAGVVVTHLPDPSGPVGAPIRVALSFEGVVDPAGATVTLLPEGPIALSGTTAFVVLPGQATTTSVEVTASAPGTHFVNVFVAHAGRTQATSVPVRAGGGPVALKKAGQSRVGPDGQRYRVMQAD